MLAFLASLLVIPAISALPIDIQTQDVKESDGFGTSKRLLMIGIDGLGSFYLDPERNRLPEGYSTPVMDKLRSEGSYTYLARSSMYTVSKPNWAAIIEAAGPEETGVLGNDWVVGTELEPSTGKNTYFPSIFQLAKDQGMTVASYSDWDGFFDLYPASLNDKKRLIPHISTDRWADMFCEEVVSPKDSDIMFIHFDHVDHAGHTDGWGTESYYNTVLEVDTAMGKIINCLEQAGLAEDTLVAVVADHGGHDQDHGAHAETDIFTSLIFRGPNIRKNWHAPCPNQGYTCYNEQESYYFRNMDAAAVAAHALGFPRPSVWIGSHHPEIFTPSN